MINVREVISNGGTHDVSVEFVETQSIIISNDDLNSTVEQVKRRFKLPDQRTAWTAIAVLMNAGAVNDKKNVNIKRTIGTIQVDSPTLNAVIKNSFSGRIKIRQFARILSDEIFITISGSKNPQPGFLVNDLEKNFPIEWDAIKDPNKKYWACDFHNENKNCPSEIRELLVRRFDARFRTKK